MKLKKLKTVIFDDVSLYREIDSGYEDVWNGTPQNIPEEFLDYTVGSIGARRKGILDIEIR